MPAPSAEVVEALDKLKAAIATLNDAVAPMSRPDDPMSFDPFADLLDSPGLDALQPSKPLWSSEQLLEMYNGIDEAKNDSEKAAEVLAVMIKVGAALAAVAAKAA